MAMYPWRDPSPGHFWPRLLSMRQHDELRCSSGIALPFSTMATNGWRKHAANVCGYFKPKRGKVPKADVERLYSIAAALRASEGKK
jgi:hypothetical protein